MISEINTAPVLQTIELALREANCTIAGVVFGVVVVALILLLVGDKE